MLSRMRILSIIIAMVMAALCLADPLTIRMMAGPGYGIPAKEATDPRSIARRAVFDEFQRQNPDIRITNAGGLDLVGAQADNLFLMSMAGANAPDVFYVNLRQYYNYIDQGFTRPLDDLIAKSPHIMDRTGPIIRNVLSSFNGKIYAIPFFHVALGLYFRKDFFLDAGLDPENPPRTWEDFIAAGRKLTERDPNRAAFVFSMPPGYHFSNFVYQAGGEIVRKDEAGNWRSAINSEAGIKAVEFFRRLVNETWKGKDGKTYGPVAKISSDFVSDVKMGKAAMWFAYTNDVALATANDLPVQLVGVAAMPAGPAGPSNEINAGMWAINAAIKDPAKVEACWKFIRFFAEEEAARINTVKFVELGMANLVNPVYLEKFGFKDFADQVDQGYVRANKELFSAGHPEPYGKNCQQVYSVLDGVLDKARLEPGTPAKEILAFAEQEMNNKLIGYKPPEEMRRLRTWAAGILVGFLLVLIPFIGWLIWRGWRSRSVSTEHLAAGSVRTRVYTFIAICLAPAVISLAVWSYYPIGRGLMIAFQDYRITKPAQWVGLDNFIQVFTSPIFYKALANSFIYVGLTIAIGFLLPILLALALNEIPRFKVFFRTIFYLPAMTSPIVIAILWRQMYDKSEQGLLNSMVAPLMDHLINPVLQWAHLGPWPRTYDWLGDPKLAMLAVVLPGIWAGAGPGSILYLAALKNVPAERYEAADLDGANWIQKIFRITLPGIKPLILINLLGVFIGGFKAMENIFVLTFGGPMDATHVLGLEVWKNAFMFLRFGYATAAAWVMGAILVGFTLIQIRSLLKMRFTTVRM